MDRNQITSVEEITKFMFAGKATVTLESERTGKHFTFRVDAAKQQPGNFFVKLLTGSDNESNYTYMGMIRGTKGRLSTTRASTIGAEAPSFKAMNYVLEALARDELPRGVKIWHEGRCGRCGRKLTVPESIQNGIGPECRKWVYGD